MYRIYRTYTDGHKEFVGATPSDAFYLGSFDKDGSETACTFEITSYSENGVKAARRPSPLHGPLRWKTALSPSTTTAPTWL